MYTRLVGVHSSFLSYGVGIARGAPFGFRYGQNKHRLEMRCLIAYVCACFPLYLSNRRWCPRWPWSTPSSLTTSRSRSVRKYVCVCLCECVFVIERGVRREVWCPQHNSPLSPLYAPVSLYKNTHSLCVHVFFMCVCACVCVPVCVSTYPHNRRWPAWSGASTSSWPRTPPQVCTCGMQHS